MVPVRRTPISHFPLSGVSTYIMLNSENDGPVPEISSVSGGVRLCLMIPSGSFTHNGDSGSDDTFTTGNTLTFTGGEGIDTTVGDDVITIANKDA